MITDWLELTAEMSLNSFNTWIFEWINFVFELFASLIPLLMLLAGFVIVSKIMHAVFWDLITRPREQLSFDDIPKKEEKKKSEFDEVIEDTKRLKDINKEAIAIQKKWHNKHIDTMWYLKNNK